MVTIQGFSCKNGKLTDDTIKKMQEAGTDFHDLKKMFGEGYTTEVQSKQLKEEVESNKPKAKVVKLPKESIIGKVKKVVKRKRSKKK